MVRRVRGAGPPAPPGRACPVRPPPGGGRRNGLRRAPRGVPGAGAPGPRGRAPRPDVRTRRPARRRSPVRVVPLVVPTGLAIVVEEIVDLVLGEFVRFQFHESHDARGGPPRHPGATAGSRRTHPFEGQRGRRPGSPGRRGRLSPPPRPGPRGGRVPRKCLVPAPATGAGPGTGRCGGRPAPVSRPAGTAPASGWRCRAPADRGLSMAPRSWTAPRPPGRWSTRGCASTRTRTSPVTPSPTRTGPRRAGSSCTARRRNGPPSATGPGCGSRKRARPTCPPATPCAPAEPRRRVRTPRQRPSAGRASRTPPVRCGTSTTWWVTVSPGAWTRRSAPGTGRST